MSVKAWEKEERREREEEASWARSHRPGNKDPPPHHRDPSPPVGGSHTHAQTLTTTCNMYTNTGRIRWDGPVPRKRR